MKKKTVQSAIDIDWENRTLCSDDNCIGVIGPDGRCKECGLPFGRDVFENETPESVHEHASESINESIQAEKHPSGKLPEEVDWENRTLCSDDSCIGVIGPDGRCKECGLLFTISDVNGEREEI